MLKNEDVLEFLRKRPFEPIRIVLTDGRSYEVRHPELVMVGTRKLAIGLPRAGDRRPVYERMVTAPLLHVVRIEELGGDEPAPE